MDNTVRDYNFQNKDWLIDWMRVEKIVTVNAFYIQRWKRLINVERVIAVVLRRFDALHIEMCAV